MPYTFIFVSFVSYKSQNRDSSEKVRVLYAAQVSNPYFPSVEEIEIYVLGVLRFSHVLVGGGGSVRVFFLLFSPSVKAKKEHSGS